MSSVTCCSGIPICVQPQGQLTVTREFREMGSEWFTGRVRAILVYGDTTPATLASIGSSFLWFCCLCFPGVLIGPPGVGRPTYRFMYDVAGESTWIGIFASVFVLQIWRMFCCAVDLSKSKSTFVIEVLIKCWAAMIWTFIALACMIAQYPPAAAMSDAIVIAALCWWDMFRCQRFPTSCAAYTRLYSAQEEWRPCKRGFRNGGST